MRRDRVQPARRSADDPASQRPLVVSDRLLRGRDVAGGERGQGGRGGDRASRAAALPDGDNRQPQGRLRSIATSTRTSSTAGSRAASSGPIRSRRWRPASFRWSNCPNRFTESTANGSALRASSISRAAARLTSIRLIDGLRRRCAMGGRRAQPAATWLRCGDARRRPHRGRRERHADPTENAAPGSAPSVCGSAR